MIDFGHDAVGDADLGHVLGYAHDPAPRVGNGPYLPPQRILAAEKSAHEGFVDDHARHAPRIVGSQFAPGDEANARGAKYPGVTIRTCAIRRMGSVPLAAFPSICTDAMFDMTKSGWLLMEPTASTPGSVRRRAIKSLCCAAAARAERDDQRPARLGNRDRPG